MRMSRLKCPPSLLLQVVLSTSTPPTSGQSFWTCCGCPVATSQNMSTNYKLTSRDEQERARDDSVLRTPAVTSKLLPGNPSPRQDEQPLWTDHPRSLRPCSTSVSPINFPCDTETPY